MKILEIGSCSLTNLEVCSIVRNELVDIDKRYESLRTVREAPQSTRESTEAVERQRTSSRNVIEYLERCYPVIKLGHADETAVSNFLAGVADLGGNPALTDSEVLQILNHAPADEDMICFHGFVRDSADRFTDSQISRLRNLIQHYLLGACDLELAATLPNIVVGVIADAVGSKTSSSSDVQALQQADASGKLQPQSSTVKDPKDHKSETHQESRGNGSATTEKPQQERDSSALLRDMLAESDEEPTVAARTEAVKETKASKPRGSRKSKDKSSELQNEAPAGAAGVGTAPPSASKRQSAADKALMSPRKGLKRGSKGQGVGSDSGTRNISGVADEELSAQAGGNSGGGGRLKKRRVVPGDD